ncbi:MAG: glycosyltransferase [Puniceicoccales bacterium]|jgi:lipopolysaccharide biosynthesis glycosyltransferase/glycosyltransferase involved in cell wall biosynthesis|nr:glycosyltransferase [Puniceicoccales bacterium]
MKRKISVAYCFDDNYAIPAAVAIYSMLENGAKSVDWRIVCLSSDISAYNQKKLSDMVAKSPNAAIEFVDMSGKFADLMKRAKRAQQFTKEMFYKFLIPDILSDCDTAIVSDVDIVWTGDSSEMASVKSDVYFKAAELVKPKDSWVETYYEAYRRDFSSEERKKLGWAAGFYAMNLKKMREDKIPERCIEFAYANAKRLIQPEQDVLNLTCWPHIETMPDNALIPSYYRDLYDADGRIAKAMAKPIQVHYASTYKPWICPDSAFADIWFSVLAKTSFYKDYRERTRFTVKAPADPRIKKTIFGRKKIIPPKPVGGFGRNKVSVLCLSYNHENFIRRALDGFAMQRTNFPFGVYVADDASADGTPKIIAEYAERYPGIIKPILREKNIGPACNALDALHKMDSPYVAICDGDDCWTDENKLQKQVNFLDRNPKYDIVCANALFHHEDGAEQDKVFDAIKYAGDDVLDFSGYLRCRAIASCTAMMRWRLCRVLPEWIKRHVAVYFSLFLLHAAYGKIKILPDIFAQHNIHSAGISRKHLEKEYQKKMNEIIRYVGKWIGGFRDGEIKRYFDESNG